MHNKKYDNQLRQLARGKKSMEEVLENETLKEKWGEIEQLRVNELAEEKARLKQAAEPEETPEDPDAGTALVQKRKAPSSFTEDSEAYWLAVAHETVRRFVAFMVLPDTQNQMMLLVAQSVLKDVKLEAGTRRQADQAMFVVYLL